jgi:hypothetical protein
LPNIYSKNIKNKLGQFSRRTRTRKEKEDGKTTPVILNELARHLTNKNFFFALSCLPDDIINHRKKYYTSS